MLRKPKVARTTKGVYWIKIVNKTSSEPSANECKVPPGVISVFDWIRI